ncbi:MAG TPA: pseudouridine synthase [Thermoanaerobaculia bacterium]|nr:pseudouridine synthase [Thermoanaerobaculia bacterium]
MPRESKIQNPKSKISGVRIQKILAQAGMGSRREAEEWIREGRVFVNGKPAKLGDRADPGKDSIRVGDKRIPARPARRTYILLNKPKGYVTTVSDPERRDTVLDLLPGGLRRGMKPVGRLDVQTEGLLLLTDDGDLARDLTDPASECPKEYRVKVSGQPTDKEIDRLRRGVFLDGRRTRPATIERVSRTGKGEEGNAWFRVVLTEGRNRQIRRMFEGIGHLVSKLKRVAIGPIRDGGLPSGAHRLLSEGEVAALKAAVRAGSPSAKE